MQNDYEELSELVESSELEDSTESEVTTSELPVFETGDSLSASVLTEVEQAPILEQIHTDLSFISHLLFIVLLILIGTISFKALLSWFKGI